jgi:hypothetical protein
MRRIDKGESIEIVQKYDLDKLDYYRADLSNLLQLESTVPSGEMMH